MNIEKKHFQTNKEIVQPDVIVNYNRSVSGVDNLSQVIVLCAIAQKGLKWYHKLAEVSLELPLYNSYVIWKQLSQSNKDQLANRIDLVMDIVTFHSFGTQSCCPAQSQSWTVWTNALRLKEKLLISKSPWLNARRKRRCHRANLTGQHRKTSYHCQHFKFIFMFSIFLLKFFFATKFLVLSLSLTFPPGLIWSFLLFLLVIFVFS